MDELPAIITIIQDPIGSPFLTCLLASALPLTPLDSCLMPNIVKLKYKSYNIYLCGVRVGRGIVGARHQSMIYFKKALHL